MFPIQNLTTNSRQKQTLVLPDGTLIVISLYFIPMQYGWFITNLTYANTSFELHGLRLCNSPDLLYQYRNKIPFGLAVFSASDREPTQLEDLSSGATSLFILTKEEVDQYTEFLVG